MSDSKDATHTAFKLAWKDFLVQAVSGTVMGPLRHGRVASSQEMKIYYGIYINMCWHGYHKRSDPRVMEWMAKILSFNIIKGSHCLFNWLVNIGSAMIATVDVSKLHKQLADGTKTNSLDEKRNVVQAHLDEVFERIYPFKTDAPQCKGVCNDTYDGTDFVMFAARAS